MSSWSAEEMFARSKTDSTWNEEEYTTPINRQDPDYKKKFQQALQIEREILKVKKDGWVVVCLCVCVRGA